ncbi:MAG TPA: ATP-dependent helicase [Anaerolineales bacterium]
MSLSFSPRSSQARILEYTGGRLGISAVPGSGKTQTLSALAARIISNGLLQADQEVLVVTLVNSAVDNFTSRIADFIQDTSLIPRLGYRVRTLHGLAHDIVREDPALVGLDPQFTIMDENTSGAMIREAADVWVRDHEYFFEAYVLPDLAEHQRQKLASREWPEYVESIASSFIRAAKDGHLSPEDLQLAVEESPIRLPLVEMGLEIYSDYQRALAYRGAVDFDDLIRLAYRIVDTSPDLLAHLRHRWPYILEDEAQDSSRIQQEIISRLVGESGNWVRVGDPNQAIFETFTTAEPALLREFIDRNPSVDMPESGRSQKSIMDIANYLMSWTQQDHPWLAARDALISPQIAPAAAGDSHPNPPDNPGGIHLSGRNFTPEQEISAAVESLRAWLPQHQDMTVAVLTCTNDYAAQVAEALRIHHIEYRELLRSTTPTRAAAGALAHVLDYLASPDSGPKLSQAYKVWRRDWRDDLERRPELDRVSALLRRMRNVEEYVAPFIPAGSSNTLQGSLGAAGESDEILEELSTFRDVIRRWHTAAVLPIDQLVLTLSQEIFTEASDLALAHKLALVLRQAADENPEWRLPELIPTLNEIALNERRFIGFSNDDASFNPDDYRGIVIVSTMHKAKGLEWDRVYLLSVNNHDYPSNQPEDRFVSEKWFIRDGLNLEAEALAQLDVVAARDPSPHYREGAATLQARLDYVRERLRLLYVGITRARKELILSWNTGRRGDATPSLPLTSLRKWWRTRQVPSGPDA